MNARVKRYATVWAPIGAITQVMMRMTEDLRGTERSPRIMRKSSSQQDVDGPRSRVEDIVAQLFADADTPRPAKPRAPSPPAVLPIPAAADRYASQRDARRAERAASRMMGIFESTAAFLRELRNSLKNTAGPDADSQPAPTSQPEPDAESQAQQTDLRQVAAVVAAILLCWSVLLLRFDHTGTATGFALVGGALAWGALLRPRHA